MFGYKTGEFITAVLTSATAFVLASTVVTSGLGAVAFAAGATGAVAGTGIQILAFAGGIISSMYGFQGGLKLHEKIEELQFARTHKRKHQPKKNNKPKQQLKNSGKQWEKKLSNFFKKVQEQNGSIKISNNKPNNKNKPKNKPKNK